jgi:hypothetical protein
MEAIEPAEASEKIPVFPKCSFETWIKIVTFPFRFHDP